MAGSTFNLARRCFLRHCRRCRRVLLISGHGRSEAARATFLPRCRKDTAPRALANFLLPETAAPNLTALFRARDLYPGGNATLHPRITSAVSTYHTWSPLPFVTFQITALVSRRAGEGKIFAEVRQVVLPQSNKVALMAQKQTPSYKSCGAVDAKYRPTATKRDK